MTTGEQREGEKRGEEKERRKGVFNLLIVAQLVFLPPANPEKNHSMYLPPTLTDVTVPIFKTWRRQAEQVVCLGTV